MLVIREARFKPTPFAREQPIAVGSHTLTFTDVEAFTPTRGGLGLAVFFRWQGDNSVDYLHLALLFKTRFTLVDSTGEKHHPSTAMSAEAYRRWQGAGRSTQGDDPRPGGRAGDLSGRREVPGEWVSVFSVPAESRGFTLIFDHPKPQKGQADYYSAPLGR